MEPGNPALDDYVRSLAPAREPRICLLPTAGGDSEDQIRRFHTAFDDQLCEPTHISLFRLGSRPVPLREHLLAQDVIYVGGGSMINLLALWRAHGLDEILREAWQAGIVLAGLSAGSMCWFEWGVTKSIGAPDAHARTRLPARLELRPLRRRAGCGGRSFLDAVARGEIPAGWGGRRRRRACCSAAPGWPRSSRRGRAPARYRVHAVDGEAVEEAIEPRLLKAAAARRSASPLAVDELRALTRRAPGLAAGLRPAPRPRAVATHARRMAPETLSARQLNRATLARQGLLGAGADRRRGGRGALRPAAGAGRAAAVPRAVEPRGGLRPRGPARRAARPRRGAGHLPARDAPPDQRRRPPGAARDDPAGAERRGGAASCAPAPPSSTWTRSSPRRGGCSRTGR